ncbi:MAG: TatD family hydrolase [Nanobdellota archaeon]
MRLIDVHAHYDFKPFSEDIDSYVQKAESAGVKVIVSNGTTVTSNRTVLSLAKKHAIIKPALGLYPSHVAEMSDDEIDREISFIKRSNPSAIGEVGLDYKVTDDASGKEFKELSLEQQEQHKQRQKNTFIKFIELANELDIPIIVHSRKAEADAIDLLIRHKAKKVIMHCFMGKKKYVKQIQEQKWFFSIPVVVTKLQQVQDIVATTPLSRLFTETDAPYLGPTPGEANDSSNVSVSISKIAQIKGLTEQETADQIFMNYLRLFP